MKALSRAELRHALPSVIVGASLLCSSVRAGILDVLAPGYLVDTYAVYATPDSEYEPKSVTWDSSGNMYLSHWGTYSESTESYGSVYRVAPDRTATKWIQDIPLPRKTVWTAGSAYGDYLYIASGLWQASAILRSDVSGNVTTFAPISRAPHALALDTSGNYGGYMYTATRAGDRTYRIQPDGSISVFSEFPKPAESGGGPIDIAFDPGTAYGGLMYMATDFLNSPASSGLFSLDTSGNATRFAPDLLGGYDVEIDPFGLFSGSMFATGRLGLDRGDRFSVYQVSPGGGLSEFARAVGNSTGLMSFTFGPDGAMYIPQFFPDERMVVVSRVAPVPVPGASILGVLGLGTAAWRLRRTTA